MDEKYNAICIRSVSWRDSDKLVTLFTLENGKVDCVVRGAMNAKSKWRFAAEHFTFAEYVLKEKFGKSTLSEATQIDGFYGVRYDIDKFYAASVVIEFIDKNVAEGMKAYDLFLLTVNALKAIEVSKPFPALIRFLIGAMGELGYRPEFGDCHKCGKKISGRAFYDFDVAAPVCEDCSSVGATEMRADTLKLLDIAEKTPVEEFKKEGLSTYSPLFEDDKCLYYALKFLAYYMELKLNCRLKSLSDVLENYRKE